MPEIAITEVTPLNGGAARKGITNAGRPGFIVDVQFQLDDGRTIPGHICSERKKRLSESLANAQRSIAARAMFACFNNQGEYLGTSQKWTIGAAGLVPTAA